MAVRTPLKTTTSRVIDASYSVIGKTMRGNLTVRRRSNTV
jgi:hypothetical protein